MKHNEFTRLEEKCPKCQGELMLQKTSWGEVSGDLKYVFCDPCQCKGCGANDKETALANFRKELARKEKAALRKPEKILTDIRDYLVGKQDGVENSEINVIVKEVALGVFEAEMVVLKDYAEKLGVEL